MCATCGCADGARARHQHDDGTWHEHGAAHDNAGHEHEHTGGQTVTLEEKVLARNDALAALDPPDGSVVVIENVGKLVCPDLFDLGEAHRVVLASVTEGADKPVKYPHMFRSAGLVVVTKTDLLPYLDFDLDRCTADLGKISPGATVLPVSARAGDGIAPWYDWLRRRTLASLGG